jgi:hypothetical protein
MGGVESDDEDTTGESKNVEEAESGVVNNAQDAGRDKPESDKDDAASGPVEYPDVLIMTARFWKNQPSLIIPRRVYFCPKIWSKSLGRGD